MFRFQGTNHHAFCRTPKGPLNAWRILDCLQSPSLIHIHHPALFEIHPAWPENRCPWERYGIRNPPRHCKSCNHTFHCKYSWISRRSQNLDMLGHLVCTPCSGYTTFSSDCTQSCSIQGQGHNNLHKWQSCKLKSVFESSPSPRHRQHCKRKCLDRLLKGLKQKGFHSH